MLHRLTQPLIVLAFTTLLAACSDAPSPPRPAASRRRSAWRRRARRASSRRPIPAPPQVQARGYFLMDYVSGQVLAAINENERLEPASLTKLMTAYAVFHALKDGRIKLDDQVRISPHARDQDGSRMFVEVGTQVSVENLIQGMIVQSGNDATVALAEHVAGSEAVFVDLMNQYALQIGMSSTHFQNSPGMPGPATLHDRPRHRPARRRADSRISGVLQVVFPAGVHLEQDHAAESQRSAGSRSERGRTQDRPHGIRRLLPRLVRQARAICG